MQINFFEIQRLAKLCEIECVPKQFIFNGPLKIGLQRQAVFKIAAYPNFRDRHIILRSAWQL